jgi:hypothetical protein
MGVPIAFWAVSQESDGDGAVEAHAECVVKAIYRTKNLSCATRGVCGCERCIKISGLNTVMGLSAGKV